MQAGTQAVGYVRVSTQEQGDSGLGLQAQVTQVEQACAARGWVLRGVEQDVASGKSLARRPGLERALRQVEQGEAQVLVSAKLDRVSRSLLDFASLLDRVRRGGGSLVVLDAGVDTSTPNGEAMVGMIAVFAQLERRLIGERTKAALAVARDRGQRLGRPRVEGPRRHELVERVEAMRAAGHSYRRCAELLEADGEATVTGSHRWTATAVRRLATAG